MEEQAAVNRWMQVRFLPMPPCYMGEPGIVEPGRAGKGIINDFRNIGDLDWRRFGDAYSLFCFGRYSDIFKTRFFVPQVL